MSTTTAPPAPPVVVVERVDDLPVLLATLQRLEVATLLDRQFPTHPLWEGELSFGEVVCVWLAFLLSQGDHRLSHVQPWAQQNLHTLRACLGKDVRDLDVHDDRLADILDALAQPEPWQAFETDLNRSTVRVYDLKASRFRIDTTTVNTHADVVSPEGLLQFGHSKDDPSRPQLKVAACVLDPLGLPITTAVVAGNVADDVLYVPQIRQVQESFGKGGKTYIGDCKMAAFATRLDLAGSSDFYLCPLAESQLSAGDRRALLEPLWRGEQALEPVFRPQAEGEQGPPELVAEGFRVEAALHGESDGRLVEWTEYRWVVRSVAYAQAQEARLDERLAKAEAAVARLNERRQGKKRLSLEETEEAVQRILAEHGVQEWLFWSVHQHTSERPVRGYRGAPARVEVVQEVVAEAWRWEEGIAQAKRGLGWQVYAANDPQLCLSEVVWGYRGQYQIEKDWSRLKGRPLSLTPMYLQDEERMQGLVLLLSIALRVLSLLEWQVRQALARQGLTLRGLYPGQPGRQTDRPSAELLLRAWRGISLVVEEGEAGPRYRLTPLSPLQERLLQLWELPPDLYQRLLLHSQKPPPGSSEP
jgi:transposase